MTDVETSFPQLIAALRERGASDKDIAEAVDNIREHKVGHLYWNEADKQRIVLDVFALARTRAFLQDCLDTHPHSDGEEAIQQSIREIDAHFSLHHWPTSVADDDPVLLREFWRQHNAALSASERLADDATRTARIAALTSEKNRILRRLLKLPASVSVQGQCAPVASADLADAFHGATDKSVSAVIEDELQARFPSAYDLLEALHDSRSVARCHRLVDLKGMSSQGFSSSIVQSREALAELGKNLAIARRALGGQRFASIASAWDRLDKLRLIAVLDLQDCAVNLGGYHFAYPLEVSRSQMPPWIEDNGMGEPRNEGPGDAGCYILLCDLGRDASFSSETRQQLRAQYLDIRNNLVKPNYDALQLIVAHADAMTKLTALTIVSLLAKMLEAYRQIASPAHGGAGPGEA